MLHPRLRHVTLIAAFVGATLLGSGVPTFAGFWGTPDPVAAGKPGPWGLIDTDDDPSVRCHFDTDGATPELDRLVIVAPRVRWPDTHPGKVDNGKVRWRTVVQQTLDGGQSWSKVTSGPGIIATATETRRAAFVSRQQPMIGLPDRAAWVRVKHLVTWLRPDGSVRGSVTVWSEVYRESVGANLPHGGCRVQLT